MAHAIYPVFNVLLCTRRHNAFMFTMVCVHQESGAGAPMVIESFSAGFRGNGLAQIASSAAFKKAAYGGAGMAELTTSTGAAKKAKKESKGAA